MNSPFLEQLAKRLEAIAPAMYNRLHELDQFPERVGRQVVSALLDVACRSQHVGNIQASRTALSQIPPALVRSLLADAIDETLDPDDEWEYRRLLELLRDQAPEFLARYVDRGLASTDSDIREAASEFVTR